MTDMQRKYFDINEAATELETTVNGIFDLCSQVKLRAYTYFDLKFEYIKIFDGVKPITKRDVRASGYYNTGRFAALSFCDDNSYVYKEQGKEFNFFLADTEYLDGVAFNPAHQVFESMLESSFDIKMNQLRFKREEIESYKKLYKGKLDMQSKSLIAKKQKWDRVYKLVISRPEFKEWLTQSPEGLFELHHKFKRRLIDKLMEEKQLDSLNEKNLKTLPKKVNEWLKELARERGAHHLIHNIKTAKKNK